MLPPQDPPPCAERSYVNAIAWSAFDVLAVCMFLLQRRRLTKQHHYVPVCSTAESLKVGHLFFILLMVNNRN